MCWYSGKTETVKTAEKDIECFKICSQLSSDGLMSVYRDQFYEIGKEYSDIKTDIPAVGISLTPVTCINVGFHSYSRKCKTRVVNERGVIILAKCRDVFIDSICSGHSMISKYKYIIPKGSKYLENDYGEIVSDRIIIKECEEVLYNYNI